MTRRRSLNRPLCPLGCIDRYVPDPETGERLPCPVCQAERLAAVGAARAACGDPPIQRPDAEPLDLSPAERAQLRADRLAERARRRALTLIQGDR